MGRPMRSTSVSGSWIAVLKDQAKLMAVMYPGKDTLPKEKTSRVRNLLSHVMCDTARRPARFVVFEEVVGCVAKCHLEDD